MEDLAHRVTGGGAGELRNIGDNFDEILKFMAKL